MRKTMTAIAIALATLGATPLTQAQTGGAVVASEPGKVTIADAVRVAASVQAIDKAKRLVTLKGPEGNTFVVEAGDEYRLLGVNALDEFALATPAIVGDRLLIRTSIRKVRS